jgi:hypothetical protein
VEVEHSGMYKIPTVEVAHVHKTNKLSSITNNLDIRNKTTALKRKTYDYISRGQPCKRMHQ